MCNSISTIFTVDVAPALGIESDGGVRAVTTGRIVAMVAMAIAMVAAKPLLGNFEQAFQYIQEFTGFFTPGIVAIFMLGLFWSRTTATAALSGHCIGGSITRLQVVLAGTAFYGPRWSGISCVWRSVSRGHWRDPVHKTVCGSRRRELLDAQQF